MTSTTNDIYETLVKKSKITDNYATLTHAQVDTIMVPCDDLYSFYNDSLFYLHLYNSLYLETVTRNNTDNSDVQKFKRGVEGLLLKFDTATSCSNKMGNLAVNSSSSGYEFTFNTNCFTSNSTNSSKYVPDATLGSKTDEEIKNVTPESGNTPTSVGKIKFTINYATGRVTSVVDDAGSGYTGTPTVISPREGYSVTLSVISGGAVTIASRSDTLPRINLLAPQLNNIEATGITVNTSLIDTSAGTTSGSVYSYNLSNNAALSSGLLTKYTSYNEEARKQKFRRVIYEILNTPVENFISYLFYNRVYYNVIVCNASIQTMIRNNYLNKLNINLNDVAGFNSNTQLSAITLHITNMKTNLNNLKTSIGYVTSDFIKDKSKYGDKIILLNNTKQEYYKVETSLNRVIKDYNSYYENYQRIKIYASAIIVFLILLIIAAVAITVLPFFSYNSKNTYYIVILIILIVMLGIYYANFRHVGLYETFTCSEKSPYNPLHPDATTRNNHLTNNYNFFNTIIDYLNTYNNAYTDLNDELSASVFIGNNKTYSQDANEYLYKLYVDKKRRTDHNRLKKVSLTNHIEAMKKQIVYLFNIILVISFLAIILLISLIVYTSAPFYLNYVIAFATIAIFTIIIFFIFSLKQPTRMKANKNYWANKNPADETINNL